MQTLPSQTLNGTTRSIPLWRQAFRAVLPHWIVFCVVLFLFGIALQYLPGTTRESRSTGSDWAANLLQVDAFSNLMLAEQGYGIQGRVTVQSSVRYPAFPMLVRMVMRATGIAGTLAMFIVSKLALFGGLIGLWLLVEHLYDAEHADRVTPYMLYSVLGSGYTWFFSFPEPLHLFTWTFGFYFIFTRRYVECGAITVLGVWARPHAILILPAYALILLGRLFQREYRGLFDARLWWHGLWVGVIPFAAHSAWLYHISFITELAYSPISSQIPYGRYAFIWPWESVHDHLRYITAYGMNNRPEILFELGQITLIVVALIVMAWGVLRGRVPLALAVFSALCVGLGLGTAIFAIGRYALLTWIPLAFIPLIPKKYDAVILPIGVTLTYLLVVLISITEWRFVA